MPMPFSDLGLSTSLAEAASHHAAPTTVQTRSIPVVLKGQDVLCTAPTGSGKTTAFVLPLLDRWLATSREDRRPVHTLILVPTRELAAQVREVVQQFSQSLSERVKMVSAVGGSSINPQMMALRGGADFLVATPGRLLDLVDSNAVKLSGLSALVLDEADRMLDLGFADELSRILKLVPERRQNLLFSATFPATLESLAMDLLHDPARVEIETLAGHADTPAIEQRAIRVDTPNRTPLLRHLIKTHGWKRVLVFVARQYSADHVADKLRRKGIMAEAFHGGLSQGARTRVLEEFQSASTQVLVATDLAARGLDIVKLPAVVHYDLPRSSVDFIHRSGRTARAGESGVAVSFVTAESYAHFAQIEKAQKLTIPREEVSGFEPTEVPPPKSPGVGGIKGHRKSKKDKLREAAAKRTSWSALTSDNERPVE